MWIAVESLRCSEHELGRVAQCYHVPLEMVRRCRSIAFRALEEAFWEEDPCRLVPPPASRRQRSFSSASQETPATASVTESDPGRFVEKLLHRVHLKSSQPLSGKRIAHGSRREQPEPRSSRRDSRKGNIKRRGKSRRSAADHRDELP